MYVCPMTLDGGEIIAISDKTYRERREYLAGGDYMLEGLGKGFLYMVGISAGIYVGGVVLAGASVETAATSILTHRTVIQGSQIATEIMASEAGMVGVGGAAAVGAKQVAEVAAKTIPSLGAGRIGVKQWLQNAGNLERGQLIKDIEGAGFKKVFDGKGMMHFERGGMKIRLDPPQKGTPFNHMHLDLGKKKFQSSYDIFLNRVPYDAPEAHIPIR